MSAAPSSPGPDAPSCGAAPGFITLQGSPSGPPVRIQTHVVLGGALALQGVTGYSTAALHSGSYTAIPGGAQVAPPAANASAGMDVDDAQLDGTVDDEPVFSEDGSGADGGWPAADDDPQQLLNLQQYDDPPDAACDAAAADGFAGGPSAEAAATIDRFLDLAASVGFQEALIQLELELGTDMMAAVSTRLWEQSVGVQQPGDEDVEPDWGNGHGDSPGGQPGSAAYYRERLTDDLYPGARMSLLQYIVFLLQQRGAHCMRDQCLDEMLRMHHEKVLPEGNILPPSLHLLLNVSGAATSHLCSLVLLGLGVVQFQSSMTVCCGSLDHQITRSVGHDQFPAAMCYNGVACLRY